MNCPPKTGIEDVSVDEVFVFYEKGDKTTIGGRDYCINELYQGDIFEYIDKKSKEPEYLLLINQSCDINKFFQFLDKKESSGNSDIYNIPIKKFIFISLVKFNKLGTKNKKTINDKISINSPNENILSLNLNPDFNDKVFIPKNTIISEPTIAYFSNIESFGTIRILTALENGSLVKKLTLSSPLLENLTSKFGFYYSRVSTEILNIEITK